MVVVIDQLYLFRDLESATKSPGTSTPFNQSELLELLRDTTDLFFFLLDCVPKCRHLLRSTDISEHMNRIQLQLAGPWSYFACLVTFFFK